MGVIKHCTAFLIFAICIYEDQGYNLPHNGHKPMLRGASDRRFSCIKERECTPGGEEICGFDQIIPFLAVFGDICTMYRANCRGFGQFTEIDMIVCKVRQEYDKKNPNETFEYIHINRTTRTFPTLSTIKIGFITGPPKKDHKKFVRFHCMKRRECTVGGDAMCGIDHEQQIIAAFPDLCSFHAVNCIQQGRYKRLKTRDCNATILFDTQHITLPSGERLRFYMTNKPTTAQKIDDIGDIPGSERRRITSAMDIQKIKNWIRLKSKPDNLLDFDYGVFGYIKKST